MSEQTKQDAANYHDMAKPFTDPAAAQAAVDAFWQELYELRNKHRIPDVLVTLRLCTLDGDGYVHMHAGDEIQCEPMAAYTLGRCTAERQRRMQRLVSDQILSEPKSKP